MSDNMLHVHNLHAYYGKSHVLHGVNFDVRPGEIVGLSGLLGSGRTEFAKALFGLESGCTGTVKVDGKPVGSGKPGGPARVGAFRESRVVSPRCRRASASSWDLRAPARWPSRPIARERAPGAPASLPACARILCYAPGGGDRG